MNLCFIDVETTGIDPKVNRIHQISGAITDKHCNVLEEFEFFPQVIDGEIHPIALKVGNVAVEEIVSDDRNPPSLIHKKLCSMFDLYVDKFNKKDKLAFIAYNSPFDNAFVREFWSQQGDKYFGSYFWTPDVCVMRMAMVHAITHNNRGELPNFQLQTVAAWLGIKVDTGLLHDSTYDISLTIDVYRKLTGQE